MAFAKNVEGKPAASVENAAGYVPSAGAVTVFSATWCGHCTQLKHELKQAGVTYTEVNIEEDAVAEKVAAAVNGGDWVIPTVLFPDGRSLVNPGSARIQAQLG